MPNHFFYLLLISLSFYSSAQAATSIFRIEMDPSTCTGNCIPIKNSIDSSILATQRDIQSQLPNAEVDKYLDGMAESTITAGKVTGYDNVNDFNLIALSAGVGVGVDVGNNKFSDLLSGDIEAKEMAGFGAQGSLNVGFNLSRKPEKKLGPIQLNRLSVFVNYNSYDYDKDNINLEMKSLGIHFRYKLIPSKDIVKWKMLHWGGLYLTTGFEQSTLGLSLSENFNEQISGSGYSGSFNADAKLDVDVDVKSIPIEISTNIQLLYLLTIYGGLGLDYNLGDSKANAYLSNSNISVNVSGGSAYTGRAILDLGDKGKPGSFGQRAFVGFQLNIWALKAYAQLSKSFSDDTYGVGLGVRTVF